MKNQQGIVWAPVLIMIGVVVVTGVAAYLLIKGGNTNEASNSNANVAIVNQATNSANSISNTNSATNTNQVVNKNASVNTNATANTNTVNNTNTVADLYAGWETLLNEPYDVQFRYPKTYFASSNHYGVIDPAKAEAFFFRKTSTNYNGVPMLEISAYLTKPKEQPLKQFAESVYNSNQSKSYTTTELTEVSYDGSIGYSFGLKTGYADPYGGGLLLDSVGGRATLLLRGDKVLLFLQTGADSVLESIMSSVNFR